jgi:phosphate transport system substrate-binding protein
MGSAVAALALGVGCQQVAPPHRPAGSETLRGVAGAALLPLVQKASSDLRVRNPQLLTEVSEGRSNVAIRKVVDGEADIAFTSRPVRAADVELAAEKHAQLHMIVIAAEAVALIVHSDNPIDDISVDMLRKVFFTGEIRDWSQLTQGKKSGPIHVLAVNPKTSGTGDLFVTTIAGEAKPEYVSDAVLVDYSDATVARVAADPDAISFSGMGNVNASLKALTIDRVPPNEQAILDTSYVLNRKLYAVTRGPAKGSRREFIKFLLSDAGQHLARASGMTPIALD